MDLRDTLKKSQGGSIGVTIDGKKVWFDEDKFMKLLDDPDTKEKVLEYIAPGRQKLDDEGDLRAKGDISEAPDRPEIAPPKPVEAEAWNETEPETVYNENMAEKPQLSSEDRLEPPAEVIPQTQDEKAKAKIMSQEGKDPHGETKKDEYEKITPENLPEYAKKWREAFDREAKRFAFLKDVNPNESARMKIEKGAEDRFNEYFNGEKEIALLDEYRKDKDPESKKEMYDFDKWEMGNKEQIIKIERAKYADAQSKYKDLLFNYKTFVDEQKLKVKEITKQREEEAAKVTPDEKIKNMESLAKSYKSLQAARDSRDTKAEEILMKKIELLKKKPGNEAEAGGTVGAVQTSGEADPAKVSRYVSEWRRLGYSDEKIAAMTERLKKLIKERGKNV